MANDRRDRPLRSSDRPVSRSTRHAKPTRTYRESSEDADHDFEVGSDDSDEVPLARKRRQRQDSASQISPAAKRSRTATTSAVASSSRPQRHVSKSTKPQPRSPPKKKKPKIHNAASKVADQSFQIPIGSSGIIPPWASLPYHVLVQVFYYASHPLYDERTFQPTTSLSWLLKTSRICRAFTEPALTILYRNPCLLPMERAHRLVALLKADPEPISFNYRQKIEQIAMEVAQTAAYSLSGSGLLDLHGLIFNSPRLRDLELYHQKDMSPYRTLDDKIKWAYPKLLFSALASNVEGVPTKLRSWRWSSRMAGKEWPLDKLVVTHTHPSFVGLRKIAFVNYQMPLKREEEAIQPEQFMAEALAALPNLDTLIFESSTLLNYKLLPNLPKNLHNIEFINCWEITSDDMSPFLQSHGAQLRTLTLNHNQSLSLSFLEVLGAACPHLISLKMNLTYYNLHSTYRDSQPLYSSLLLEGEIPTWPTTLQTIELIQLRNWDLPTAETFFRSLVRSADQLPDLRRLVIKAILSESWRERMVFRDRWVDCFDRVFKRRSKAPDPNLRSIDAYKKQKGQAKIEYENQLKAEDDEEVSPSGTPRGRRSQSRGNANGNRETGSPSPAMTRKTNAGRRGSSSGKRLTRGRPGVYKEISSESEGEEEVASEFGDESKENGDPHESPAKRRINRELAILKRTAGFHGPNDSAFASASEDDSDDEPLAKRSSKGKERTIEHIQGMCDVVDVRIDNLRPTENQFEEADFLDSEPEGDEDWSEGAELPEERGGYAW